MKRNLAYIILLVLMTGCVSTQQNKKEFIRELGSTQLFGDPLSRKGDCTCGITIIESLANLSKESNKKLSSDKTLKFAYAFSGEDSSTEEPENWEDPFAELHPCPIHDVRTNGVPIISTTKYRWMTIWQRLTLLADICDLEIDVFPENRTILLYNNERPTRQVDHTP